MPETSKGEAAAARLRESVRPLLDLASSVNPRILYRDPPDGEWSFTRIYAHVAEIIPYWTIQADDVATREVDDQPFGRVAEDPDRIAAVEDHARDSLDTLVERIRNGTEVAAATLKSIPDERWVRTAHHQNRGEMSVQRIVDEFLLHHVSEHTKQARRVMGQIQEE